MLHQVVQVIPKEDYSVYVYFADGAIKRYDVNHLVGSGVFAPLRDLNWYMGRCTAVWLSLPFRKYLNSEY